jgi:tight adherence protein B
VLSGWAPLAAAVALLCWPHRPARSRTRHLHGPQTAVGRSSLAGASSTGVWATRMLARRRGLVLTAGAAAVLGLVAAGPAGGAAAAVAAGTGVARRRARRRTAAELAATTDLAAALGLLAAELRAGAHPAAAAERVASDTTAHAAAVLRTVAVTSRLCGDVSAALCRHARSTPALERPLGRLAAAWTLAQDHGIPLADVLDTVRGDLAHRVGADRRLHAALAGPRATAAVLAGLPVLGLLMGQAVGAGPWRVLTGGAAGQLLLLTGTVLICAGLTWSAWLVGRAAAT